MCVRTCVHVCMCMQVGTVSDTDTAEEVGLTSLLMPSPAAPIRQCPQGHSLGDAQEEEVEVSFFLPSLYLDNI